MANYYARPNRPNADPLGASSVHGQEAQDAAEGSFLNPRAFLARYVRRYEKLRAEGVDVEAAMKLVREELEREQAATSRARFDRLNRQAQGLLTA